MYALDTNLLVYAHNTASPFHAQAQGFIEQVMNERDADGNLSICLPAQVLTEFLNVITWHRLESPLPLPAAIQIVQDYLDTGITILHNRPTQLDTLLTLLKSVATRRKVFDMALVATLLDHNVPGIYTVNVKDFKEFTFLDVRNPFE
jgi:uncharacterized protein